MLLGSLLMLSFIPVGAIAVAQEEEEDAVRRGRIRDDLTAAVEWDEIEIRGGLFPFDQRPLTSLPISPGLKELPEDITRTVEWTAVPPRFDEETQTVVDADPSVWRDYSVTETFSFSMNAEGVCCTVGYEGEGTQQIGAGEPIVMTGAGTLGDFLPIAGRSYSSFVEAGRQEWGLPFGEVEKFDSPTRETLCRRPVVDEQRDSAVDWVTTFNGQDGGGIPGPNFDMYTGCDVAGFDVETAQQMLPPVPAATAPERDVLFGSTTGTGCPVFQEAFNALYDPSMGDAPTNDIRRMMLNPNTTACTADVTIGEEGPGGLRSEMHYEMATSAPDIEAKRQFDAAESQSRVIPPHELDKLCAFDDRGVPQAPSPGEKCNLHTFHELGGGTITIATDYASEDGPNVIVRGDLQWGLYYYRCHHCDASSPEVAGIIIAMEVFGNTGLGNFGKNAQVIGSVGAPEGRVGETQDVNQAVDPELIELLTDDPYEAAVIAAVIGLIGSIGVAGVTVAEERLGRKEEEAPPTGDDRTVRIYDPEKGHGVWLTPEEAEERLAELREKEVLRHDTETEDARKRAKDKRTKIAAEAAERMRRRREEEARWADWEERIKARDGLERRQDLLEADSMRKNSWADWAWNVLDDMSRGAQEDVLSLWPDVKDAIVTGILWTADELTDAENWTVLWETTRDSITDTVLIALGDPSTRQRVADNMVKAVETASQVADTLWEVARKDPSGAAAGVVKILLGVENWEKVVDGDRTLAERLARVMWGALETGTALWGAGNTAVKVADKIADLARGADVIAHAASVARQADAVLDAMKAADAAADAARAADNAADAARLADAAADARRAAEAEAEVEALIRLREVARRDAWVRNLPEGAVIERNWLHEVGYTQDQIDELARIARSANPPHGILIGSRATNMDAMRWIRDGKALPKPAAIKAKTISRLDTYLGASPADEGLVGYFRPRQPDYSKIPKEFHEAIRRRYDTRLKEYNDLRGDVTKLISEGKVINKDGKLFAVASDGRHIPYAGDIDLVYLRYPDGSHLSPQDYQKVMARLEDSGAQIQHGAETDFINFKTKDFEPGSPEWVEAYQDAIKTFEKLQEGHTSGAEIVVQMGPDGVLRRGPRLDHIPQLQQST